MEMKEFIESVTKDEFSEELLEFICGLFNLKTSKSDFKREVAEIIGETSSLAIANFLYPEEVFKASPIRWEAPVGDLLKKVEGPVRTTKRRTYEPNEGGVKRLKTAVIPPRVDPIQCKYFPRCTNSKCVWYHPDLPQTHGPEKWPEVAYSSTTICRFGSACFRSDCYFSHPSSDAVEPTKPHISDRGFSSVIIGDTDDEDEDEVIQVVG